MSTVQNHQQQGISNRIPAWLLLAVVTGFTALSGILITTGHWEQVLVPGWFYILSSTGFGLYLGMDIHDELKAKHQIQTQAD